MIGLAEGSEEPDGFSSKMNSMQHVITRKTCFWSLLCVTNTVQRLTYDSIFELSHVDDNW